MAIFTSSSYDTQMYNMNALNLPFLLVCTSCHLKCLCGCSSIHYLTTHPLCPHLLWTACSIRRQIFALTHYTVKSPITHFQLSCVLNFNHYKHCSKCYEKKCTLGLCFSIQGRQKRITTFTSPSPPPQAPLSEPQNTPTLRSADTCETSLPVYPSIFSMTR